MTIRRTAGNRQPLPGTGSAGRRGPALRGPGALVCAVAVAATTLAGCASDTAGGDKVITALVPAAGAGLASQYAEYYKALAAEFKATTGATVKFQYFNSPDQETTLIQTSLVSGSGPDIVDYGSSFGGTLYETGGFLTLTEDDWKAVGGRDTFIPALLSMSGKGEGKEIGIPHTTVPYVMAYNTAMFAKAGIDRPPTTWTEWIDDAKRLQKANPGVHGVGIDPADGFDPWKFAWSYTHQLGGSGFLSKDGKTAALDSPQLNSAVDFYFAQIYQHKVAPAESLTWNNAQMVAAFLGGKVAMLPIATNSVQLAAADQPIAKDIGLAPMPNVPYGMTERPAGGTPAQSIVAGRDWAIPSYAKGKKDLALALAKASVSPSVNKKQYELTGWMPATTAGMDQLATDHPEAKPLIAVAGQEEPTEFTGAWSYIQTGIGTAIKNVAGNLATTGSWKPDYLTAQLANQNKAVQAHL
ncbi:MULTISPECIES: ABC transporter substrate-binding protein [unclassified Streptomyces]|uniref:ABC transporter substrate-binding protein n=1 Tax=unclassified Streptomyces TaxID=2593676 RepID=UPI002E27BF1E|nr:extracellular solute-binding protein [Streptomyces sp. NBC_00223]